jgi:hypothetical protein
MNNLDPLLRLLVPLIIFLVISALNQIFNKETGAAAAKGQGLGPRPGGLPPAPRPGERAGVGDPNLLRYGPSGSSRRNEFEDIIVLRPEPTRPSARSAPQRRQGRGKSAAPAAPKAAESAASRSLGTNVTQKIDTSQIMRPLAELEPITSRSAASESSRLGTSASPGPLDLPNLAGLRQTLTSPSKIREAFLLNEILQPPLSLRRPGR